MGPIVSGMRPTGRLHLGHLHGAVRNWISLQGEQRCFFFVLLATNVLDNVIGPVIGLFLHALL